MSTLTDRYVFAVVRGLPEQQRADIDRELRASITDSIEARIEGGAEPSAAETATLVELGDPDRMAASYADRPAWLIGPINYFDYVRLIKVLYFIVWPIIIVTTSAVQLIAGRPVGSIVGTTVATAITAAAHLGFWTTLVFAVIERTSSRRQKPLMEWAPANLPQLPPPVRYGVIDLAASVVMLGLLVGAVIWQQFASVFTDAAGAPIPVLNPALWSFWLPVFFVIAIAEVAFVFAVYRTGHWTYPLAWINIPLGLAYVIPVAWLLVTGRVFNAEFLDRLKFSDSTTTTVSLALAVVIAGFGLWDFLDGFLKARRSHGAATGSEPS